MRREKSVQHFKEQIRQRTLRHIPKVTTDVIAELNPVIRGWGNYYCKAHVRKLFNRETDTHSASESRSGR